MLNVQEEICKDLWKDATYSWIRAREAIQLDRDRAIAARYLVMTHNCIQGIVVRLVSEPDRQPRVCDISLTGYRHRQDAIRQLLLGCIGDGGLSDIEDLATAFEAVNHRYFKPESIALVAKYEGMISNPPETEPHE